MLTFAEVNMFLAFADRKHLPSRDDMLSRGQLDDSKVPSPPSIPPFGVERFSSVRSGGLVSGGHRTWMLAGKNNPTGNIQIKNI